MKTLTTIALLLASSAKPRTVATDWVKNYIEQYGFGKGTDKENKPAVICIPPLGEYLDNLRV